MSDGSDPSVRPVVFNYDFSRIEALKNQPIPDDADTLWQTIAELWEPVTYRHLLRRIARSGTQEAILSAFRLGPASTDILVVELQRHLSYVDRVLPARQLLSFIADFPLDFDQLVRSLPPPHDSLFVCALHLLWTVASMVDNGTTKHQLMERFSLLLLPRELAGRGPDRPSLPYILFLPVDSFKDGKQWLTLCSDYNRIQFFSMTKPSQPGTSFLLSEMTIDLFCNEITFVPNKGDLPHQKHQFISKMASYVWEDAVNRRGGDPLYYFIASLPYIFPFMEVAPAEVFRQLQEQLTSPDLEFFHGFMKAAAVRGNEYSKLAVQSALSLAHEAQLLVPWFRGVFSIEINLMKSCQTIFRESSAASISASVYLGALGTEFSAIAAQALLDNPTNTDAGIRAVLALVDRLPPPCRVVFSSCFRATRRKYKDKLVPVIAVSSFFMLRYLRPAFATISVDASTLGQKLMNVFVFKQWPEARLGDDIPRLVGDFLLEICNVKPTQIQLPPYDIKKILQFCAENAPAVADRLEAAQAEDEHSLHWSILECLENAVFGSPEDYTPLLEGASFVL
jgi:hypothetical protein